MSNRTQAALLAGVMGLVAMPATFAQDNTTAVLDEVVVTATRRAENLQDVPISVKVVTGAEVQQGGFSDMEDLSVFVPNLFMIEHLPGQNIFIRGIGSQPNNASFEQAVAQFHDNVYFGRDSLGQNAFFDLERVEVVRGPQPTFAGQSATAGALRYVSRRPGDSLDANVLVSYGSNEETNVEFAIGGPLTDTFGLRFAARYYDLADADYTHVVTGKNLGIKENTAARLIGVWSPSDDVELTFKYENHDLYQQGVIRDYVRCETRPQFSRGHLFLMNNLPGACSLEGAFLGTNVNGRSNRVGAGGGGGNLDIYDAINALNSASGAMPGAPNFWGGVDAMGAPLAGNRIVQNADQLAPFQEQERNEMMVDVALIGFDWDIDDYTLHAQASYVEYDVNQWNDPDASAFAILNSQILETFEQTSFEVTLASPLDQTFSWMVGAYWQEHDLESSNDSYGAWQLGPALAANGNQLQETSTWMSLFFSTVWNITDAVRLNLGGRWQDVDKDGSLNPRIAFANAAFDDFEPFMPQTPLEGLKFSSDDFLPEVSLEWDAGDSAMLYVNYSEAFKAGGFVLAPAPGGNQPPRTEFGPESAEAIELGLKSRWLNGSLELNVAAFDQEYTDLQVSVWNEQLAVSVIQNAAAVSTSGIEVDGRWAVSDAFSLGYSAALTDGQYDDYPGLPCNSLEAKEFAISNPGESCQAQNNAAGVDLDFMAPWTIVITPEISFDLSSTLSGEISGNLSFSDGFSADPRGDPISDVDGFERMDIRFGVRPVSGNWEVALYGRNLTDERVLMGSPSFGAFASGSTDLVHDGGAAIVGQRGRYYGVQFGYFYN